MNCFPTQRYTMATLFDKYNALDVTDGLYDEADVVSAAVEIDVAAHNMTGMLIDVIIDKISENPTTAVDGAAYNHVVVQGSMNGVIWKTLYMINTDDDRWTREAAAFHTGYDYPFVSGLTVNLPTGASGIAIPMVNDLTQVSATDPDTVRSHIRVPASMPYMRAAIIDLNAEGHRYSVYMGYLKPATPEYTTLMSNTTVSDEAVSQVVSVDYMAHRALNLPVYFDHQNRDSEGPDAGTLYFQGKFASNAPWITIPAEEVGPGTMAFGAANGNTKSNEIDSSGKFRMFKCEPFPLMRPLLKRGNNSDRHIVGAYAIKSV